MRSKLFVLTIVLLSICFKVSGQNQVYKLHPVVGDTIDKVEIERYILFDNQPTDSIDYLVLFQNQNLFNLKGYLKGKIKLNIYISDSEVVLEKEKIEKLDKYFVSLLKKDSVKLDDNDFKNLLFDSLKIDLKIMTPDLVKSMKKDRRREFWNERRKMIRKNQKEGFIF